MRATLIRQSKFLTSLSLLFLSSAVIVSELRIESFPLIIGYSLLVTGVLLGACAVALSTNQAVRATIVGGMALMIYVTIIARTNGIPHGYDQYTTYRLIHLTLDIGAFQTPEASFRGSHKLAKQPLLFVHFAMTNVLTAWSTTTILQFVPAVVLFLLGILSQLLSRSWESVLWVVPPIFVGFMSQAVGQSVGLIVVFLIAAMYTRTQTKEIRILLYVLLAVLPLLHGFNAIVGPVFILALEGGRFIRGDGNLVRLTPAIAGITVLSAWMILQHRLFLFISELSLKLLALIGFISSRPESEGTSIQSKSTLQTFPPEWIYFAGRAKHAVGWLLFAARAVLFLTAGILFLYELRKWGRAAFTDRITLFGVSGVILIMPVVLFGGVNANRILVILVLLCAWAITSIRERVSRRRLHQLVSAIVVLTVVSHVLYLPPSTFDDDADPPSYVGFGRPIYHGPAEIQTAEFLGESDTTAVAADIAGLLAELRNAVEMSSSQSCYQSPSECKTSHVWWLNRYTNRWQSRATGETMSFPGGEARLNTQLNRVYTTGNSTVFRNR